MTTDRTGYLLVIIIITTIIIMIHLRFISNVLMHTSTYYNSPFKFTTKILKVQYDSEMQAFLFLKNVWDLVTVSKNINICYIHELSFAYLVLLAIGFYNILPFKQNTILFTFCYL